LVERLRLESRPRHPRKQMLDARVDCFLDQRRVLGVVAADDEPLGLDPVRSRHSARSGSAVTPRLSSSATSRTAARLPKKPLTRHSRKRGGLLTSTVSAVTTQARRRNIDAATTKTTSTRKTMKGSSTMISPVNTSTKTIV